MWDIALKPFSYKVAYSIEEALALLTQHSPNALPISGGTDLLVRMKQNLVMPKVLVDITSIPEFLGIEVNEQGLRIGSTVTHAEVIASPLLHRFAPAVVAASAAVGAPQTRNLGTLGGNLTSCVPSLDGAPALLVLNAVVTLVGPKGRRQIPLEHFFVSPRCSVLSPEELLAEINIPSECLGKASCFAKFGGRKAVSLALVNAAACVEVGEANDHFTNVRRIRPT